jgi:hypothetical protein
LQDFSKKTSQKKGWWSGESVGPEFKPQHHKKKKKNTSGLYVQVNQQLKYKM